MDTHLKGLSRRESDLIRRHNGIDIVQSEHEIKMHCQTYLKKILHKKKFGMTITKHKPLPMDSETKSVQFLGNDIGPQDHIAQAALEDSVGFKYQNVTGELIFAMITCPADIAFLVITLTQCNSNPSSSHYEAVKKFLSI